MQITAEREKIKQYIFTVMIFQNSKMCYVIMRNYYWFIISMTLILTHYVLLRRITADLTDKFKHRQIQNNQYILNNKNLLQWDSDE